IALRSTLPFQPPLPTMRNLPFQPLAGSHTSILMSESAVGLSVAATRQNAGRSANGLPPPRPPGWENAPAATASAAVIVACGNATDERLSQLAAAAGAGLTAHTASVVSAITTSEIRSCITTSSPAMRRHITPGPQWALESPAP